MYLAIPIFIVLLAVAYSTGSSSKNNEVKELNERVRELEGKLEEELGENWEEDMEKEKEDEDERQIWRDVYGLDDEK